MNKLEYDKMLGINNFEPKHITQKEKKIAKVVALKGKDEKYWDKCTSKQLGGIIRSEQNNLFKMRPITQ